MGIERQGGHLDDLQWPAAVQKLLLAISIMGMQKSTLAWGVGSLEHVMMMILSSVLSTWFFHLQASSRMGTPSWSAVPKSAK